MANYKIDPFLKNELNNHKIERMSIDFKSKTITLWHSSAELNEEFERQYQRTEDVAFNNGMKADYAFNVNFVAELLGVAMKGNEIGGEGTFKTTLRYDVNKKIEFNDT